MTSKRKVKAQAPERSLTSLLERVDPARFEGFVVDPGDLGRRFVVEVLLDGSRVKLLSAQLFRPDLLEQGLGDGCYGFAFAFPPEWVSQNRTVCVRIANSELLVGTVPIEAMAAKTWHGAVEWAGGLQLSGWVEAPGDADGAMLIGAYIRDELVAETPPQGWTQIVDENFESVTARSFDLYLPAAFADGKVHSVVVKTSGGRELRGSPLRLLAAGSGLAAFLTELPETLQDQSLAQPFRQFVPCAVPMSAYPRWKRELQPEIRPHSPKPLVAVVLAGDGGVEATLASLEAQSYPHWVAGALGSGGQAALSAAELSDFLDSDASDAGFFMFALGGTQFGQHAIDRLTAALLEDGTSVAAYPDIELPLESGEPWPIFFPAFDYERALEQGYCAHAFMIRREQARLIAGQGASTLYAAFAALLDADGPQTRILHVPGAPVLLPKLATDKLAGDLGDATAAHLKTQGTAARLTRGGGALFPAVHVRRRSNDNTKVSVILQPAGQEEISACIDKVVADAGRLVKEILVIDHGLKDPAEPRPARTGAPAASIKTLRYRADANLAAMLNRSVAAATGELVCLLAGDSHSASELWLGEMVGRMAGADTGAVGPILVWDSGIVRQCGIVLGPNFATADAFADAMAAEPGYSELMLVAHQASAVGLACLLTRRSDYLEVGGLDAARFPRHFADVDYCLRLKARGRRIVVTPHARLSFRQSPGRRLQLSGEKHRLQRELAALRWRWGDVLENDPLYHPALGLGPYPYRGLAWPPRSTRARTGQIDEPRNVPADY